MEPTIFTKSVKANTTASEDVARHPFQKGATVALKCLSTHELPVYLQDPKIWQIQAPLNGPIQGHWQHAFGAKMGCFVTISSICLQQQWAHL